MLRSAAASTIAIITLTATAVFAQGNGRNSARNQGIPPGQMPPAGQCRVWYEGRPPGQQPRPTNCDNAERVASRDRNARVIYGNGTYGRDDRYGRDGRDDRYGRDDRRDRNADIYGRNEGRIGRQSAGFDQGYRDGVAKAQEDMRDGDRYDPARHGWYKDADRGYNSRYGSRDDYRAAYRSGFVDGYDNTYRDNRNTNPNTRRIPDYWPF
jgi:hypothetical protein